jgi:hypothetical protein
MIILMISNVRTHPVHYYTIHGFAGKSWNLLISVNDGTGFSD